MDPIQYLIDKDLESPVYIEAEGPDQSSEAVRPFTKITIRYADGCEIILDGNVEKRDDVAFMEGPNGKMFRNMRSTIPDLEKKIALLPDPPPQEMDFHKCVRERIPFGLNDVNGHRSCTLVNMAKIAVRLRRPLHFDPVKQRFINDDAANRMVEEPMRAPWRIA